MDERLCFFIDYMKRDKQSKIDISPEERENLEKIISVPEEYGTGYTKMLKVKEGIGLGQFVSHGAKDRLDLRMEVTSDCFKITFHDSPDRVNVGIENLNQTIALDRNDSYILSPAVIGTVSVLPDTEINETSFLFPSSILYRVIEDINCPLNPLFEKMLHNPCQILRPIPGRCTAEMRIVVEQIRNCRMKGNLKKMYIEGKLLEFLALRLYQLCIDTGASYENRNTSFSRRDREKIKEAVNIVSVEMNDPPSIQTLSRLVGLNTTKLKKGFKLETGTTVFGYLHKLRMMRALLLLRDTDTNVNEIGWEVGYSSPAAFSAAFRRQFGANPSEFKKFPIK